MLSLSSPCLIVNPLKILKAALTLRGRISLSTTRLAQFIDFLHRFIFLSMNLTDAPIGYDGKFMLSVPPWCNLFDYCKTWQFRFEPFLFVNIYLIAAQYQLFSPPSLECILDTCLYILRLGLWFHVFTPNLHKDLLTSLISFNYYRVIKLDWSTGFWWVLPSSFLELSFISLMVWTERQVFATLYIICYLTVF